MKRLYFLLTCFWLSTATSLAQSATITSFTSSWDTSDNRMIISWTTSQETRNAYFRVQRSYDVALKSLADVAEVASLGSGTLNRAYTFSDYNPPQTGQVYYRIQAVDLDGKIETSPLLPSFIPPRQVNPFLIYPDQIGDIVYLELPRSLQPSAVRIVNMRGTTVLQQDLIRNFIVVKSLPVGLYIMLVTTSTGEMLRKRYLKAK